MNIEARLLICIALKDKRKKFLEIRGDIISPDRPLKGDTICWPYANTEINRDDEGCTLVVKDSYWVTVAIGKIAPRILLASTPNDRPEEDLCVNNTLIQIDSYLDGARLLFSNAKICWPDSSEWLPLPSKIEDFPPHILQNMPEDDC